MIPDIPHNIRMGLVKLIFLLHPDFAKSLPCWLSQFSFSKLRQPTGQRRQDATNKNFNSANLILMLWGKSSNSNSKQHRFHCAHPNVDTIWNESTYLIFYLFIFPDNWTSECIHSTKIAGGIPRSLHLHGANGRQFVPGMIKQGPLNIRTEHSNCQIHSRGDSNTVIALVIPKIFLKFLYEIIFPCK